MEESDIPASGARPWGKTESRPGNWILNGPNGQTWARSGWDGLVFWRDDGEPEGTFPGDIPATTGFDDADGGHEEGVAAGMVRIEIDGLGKDEGESYSLTSAEVWCGLWFVVCIEERTETRHPPAGRQGTEIEERKIGIMRGNGGQ